MTDTLHIKPAEGLRIRDPDRRDHLPAEGRVVPRSAYWLHRLRDADVVVVPQVLDKIVTKGTGTATFSAKADAVDKVDAEVKKSKPVEGVKV